MSSSSSSHIKVKLSKIAASLQSSCEQITATQLDASFSELFDSARSLPRESLLTGVIILTDLIPNFHISIQSNSNQHSKEHKNQLKYEESLKANLKKLITELKKHQLSEGLCKLLETNSPLIAELNGQIISSLLSSAVKNEKAGNLSVIKRIGKVLETDLELDLSYQVCKTISSQKDPKKLKHLLVLFESINTRVSEQQSGAGEKHKGLKMKANSAEDKEVLMELKRDLMASTNAKDIKKIQKNEAAILGEVLACVIRVMQSPHLYPIGTLISVMKSLERHSMNVNVELMLEIAKEIKTFTEGWLFKKKAMDREVLDLMFTSISCLLGLLNNRDAKVLSVVDVSSTLIKQALEIGNRVKDVAFGELEILEVFVQRIIKSNFIDSFTNSKLLVSFLFAAVESGKVNTPVTDMLVSLFARGGEQMKSQLDADGCFYDSFSLLMRSSNPPLTSLAQQLGKFTENYSIKRRKLNSK
jgi:hypothetical protein